MSGKSGEIDKGEKIGAWAAVIPMRAGSKQLPGKNVRLLHGVPLYRSTLATARAAGAARIYISTDIAEVLAAPDPGVTIARRPSALAADEVGMEAVLADFLATEPGKQIADPEAVVLLQPTSPLRRREDITAALELFARNEAELVISVTAADRRILKHGFVENGRFIPLSSPHYCFANRQALPPIYRPNGAIFIFRAGWFRERGGFAAKNADARIAAYIMPAERSHDIDDEADFNLVSDLMAKQTAVGK